MKGLLYYLIDIRRTHLKEVEVGQRHVEQQGMIGHQLDNETEEQQTPTQMMEEAFFCQRSQTVAYPIEQTELRALEMVRFGLEGVVERFDERRLDIGVEHLIKELLVFLTLSVIVGEIACHDISHAEKGYHDIKGCITQSSTQFQHKHRNSRSESTQESEETEHDESVATEEEAKTDKEGDGTTQGSTYGYHEMGEQPGTIAYTIFI